MSSTTTICAHSYVENSEASTSSLPSYSEDPREKETRIFYVPIPNSHREIIPSELSHPPTTIFYRKFESICTVVLDGHPSHNNKAYPVYSRENPGVSGVLTLLVNPTLIRGVTLELHGRIGRAVTLRGADSQTLFSESQSLWNPRLCKDSLISLPFSLSFPPSYEDSDGTLRQLPPSYQSPIIFSPMFTARIDYYLTVHIEMSRRSRYMGAAKTFHLDLHYRPSRKRAYAIWEDPEMLPKPEEWYRVSGVLEDSESGTSTSGGEFHLDFFTPGIRTYYPYQPIPFHVGLRGPSDLISQLFDNDLTRQAKSAVEVQVVRQIHFTLKTTRICKDTLITSVSLDSSSQWISRSSGEDSQLDIAGQLTLPGLDVESLDHPHLQLNDFLVLSVSPPEQSGKNNCRLSIPIQLVAMA